MMQSNIFAKVVPLLRELKFECAFDRLEFFFYSITALATGFIPLPRIAKPVWISSKFMLF